MYGFRTAGPDQERFQNPDAQFFNYYLNQWACLSKIPLTTRKKFYLLERLPFWVAFKENLHKGRGRLAARSKYSGTFSFRQGQDYLCGLSEWRLSPLSGASTFSHWFRSIHLYVSPIKEPAIPRRGVFCGVWEVSKFHILPPKKEGKKTPCAPVEPNRGKDSCGNSSLWKCSVTAALHCCHTATQSRENWMRF